MSSQRSAPQHRTAVWGRREIAYSLHVEERRDLLITVYPDLTVIVRAPDHKPLEHVLGRVAARRAWIANQLSQFEECSALPPPQFVPGETVLYLGREYRLRLERRRTGVVLQGGRLHVGVGHASVGEVGDTARNLVLKWYRERASAVVGKRLARLQSEIGILRLLKPRVQIRRMLRRWGSCTVNGTVSVNPALIQTPSRCVDYVLVHELIHLIEPAHSPRFYRLLGDAMPDWVARRQRLATTAVRWH